MSPESLPRASESEQQRTVIDWASHYPKLRWLHAVPNGAHLAGDKRQRAIQMSKLKAEGLKPGVGDLFLPIPISPHHGLYIEMKVKPNRQSDNQISFQEHCETVGYKYVLCWNAGEAIHEIQTYMRMK